MSEEQKKPNSLETMKKNVRRLTKMIGKANERNDFGEVTNLRNQRSGILKKLAELNVHYWIEEGKSKFGTIDEFEDFYSNPENAKKTKLSILAGNYVASWNDLNNRHDTFTAMEADKVKETVLGEMAKSLKKLEKVINQLHKKIGKKEIDFKAVREKKNNDGTDGIDWSSLMDNKDE